MSIKSTTLKEIAKQLNISKSTVSRALNDDYSVSAKTKQLVLDCARQLNYTPNFAAKSLKNGKSNVIGIIANTIDNNFIAKLLSGVELVAYQHGYNVVICQNRESYDLELSNLNYLAAKSVDGLLVSLSSETTGIAHFTDLQQKGLPMVFFDRVPDNADIHKVEANNFKASYEATTYLIKQGHTRIAQITSNPSVSITKQRLAGYHQALRDHDLPYDEQYVQYCLHGGFDMDEVEQVMNTLLKADKPPQAIIAASDRITTNCITLLYKLNYQIPQDIALLGFSNNDLINVLSPQIPIIELPAFEMGVAAAELLMRSIKKGALPFEFQSLDARLIVK